MWTGPLRWAAMRRGEEALKQAKMILWVWLCWGLVVGQVWAEEGAGLWLQEGVRQGSVWGVQERGSCGLGALQQGEEGYARRKAAHFAHRDVAMSVLLGWGVGSMVAGGAMLALGRPLTWGFGVQHLTWGLIDAIIAVASLVASQRRASGAVDLDKEVRSFRRILSINGWLDVAYLALGVGLMLVGHLAGQGKDWGPLLVGHGAGIVAQGSFLLLFDWVNVGLTFRWG